MKAELPPHDCPAQLVDVLYDIEIEQRNVLLSPKEADHILDSLDGVDPAQEGPSFVATLREQSMTNWPPDKQIRIPKEGVVSLAATYVGMLQSAKKAEQTDELQSLDIKLARVLAVVPEVPATTLRKLADQALYGY